MKQRKNQIQDEWASDDFGSFDASSSGGWEDIDSWGGGYTDNRGRHSGGMAKWMIPLGALMLVLVLAGGFFLFRGKSGTTAQSAALQSSNGQNQGAAAENSTNQRHKLGGPVMVSQPLNGGGTQGSAQSDLMDFLYYAQSELNLGQEKTSGENKCRSYSGSGSSYQVIKEYVDLLCGEYSFEMVGDPYYQDYSKNNTAFFDFVLRYTGSKNGVTDQIEGTFSKRMGSLMIYGTIERDRVKGAIWYSYALDASDDGYRYGTSGQTQTTVGESLYAGLERVGSGGYQTSDGRLKTKVGQAVIVTDGVPETYDANYAIEQDDGHLSVYVRNQYGEPVQCVYISSADSWIDGIYSPDKFIIDANYAVTDRGVQDGFPRYTWPSMFAALHSGKYVYPVRGLGGEMKGLSVRVMYQDKETLVLYTCAAFQTDPTTVEALIAVNTNVTPSSNGGSGNGGGSSYNSSTGGGNTIKTKCVFCHGDGKVECTNCGGDGGKYAYNNSTPNYSGSTSFSSTSKTWERCFKCSGSGKQTCTHCGGAG